MNSSQSYIKRLIKNYTLSGSKKWCQFNNKRNQDAFTLIELLIVMAIVSFLASVFLPTLQEARAKGEDARRVGSLKSLQNEVMNQTSAGTTPFTGVFTSGAVATKLNKLIADAGLAPGTYTSYSDATSFAVVIPMKTDVSKYWCIDAEGNSKQVPGLIITTIAGPKTCNNATGPVLSLGGSATMPFTTSDTTPDIIVSVNVGDTVTIPGYICTPTPATGTTVTCTTVTAYSTGVQVATVTTAIFGGGYSISNVSFTVTVPSGPSILGVTGASPVGIVIDSSGNVYTANIGANNVSKITPSGVSTILASTGSGSQPNNIVIDSSGNLYTSNSGTNNVSKITPAGVSTILGTTGSQPLDIAIDSSGNVYTANSGSNNVTKITPAGVSTILGTTGSQPSEIVVDSSGNVFTANKSGHSITKITPLGVSTTFATLAVNAVEGIAIDSSNNLYVTDQSTDHVTKITPSATVTTFASTDNAPSAVAVSSSGTVYVGNLSMSTVTKITSGGSATLVYATVDPFPDDLVVDSSGVVYVVNSDYDTVTKITP